MQWNEPFQSKCMLSPALLIIKIAFLLEAILHYCCKCSYSLNMLSNHQIGSVYCIINNSTFFFWGLGSNLVFLRCLVCFSWEIECMSRERPSWKDD